MIRCIALIVAMLSATGAIAQNRPTTTSLRCAQASALVNAQGAIVLNTGPYTYDRYVSSGRYCGPAETPEPTWVPSADTQQCFIGYICRPSTQRQSGR